MLQIIFPIADVPVAVGEVFGAFSVHFSIFEVTFVPGLIWPDEGSFALHIVVLEFSFVEFARVCKVVLSISVELTVDEVSIVVASFEFEAAMARLLSVDELAGVFYFIIVP